MKRMNLLKKLFVTLTAAAVMVTSVPAPALNVAAAETVDDEDVAPDDPYGYLMVHFVEDSAGYAEKIYLDISDGDDPERWIPLNNREPILASNLGTTGVRDPFITYNPETETYYIIGTDLRVFGGDEAGWDKWCKNYSTKMNVWESKDLITWSDVRQLDVTFDSEGEKIDDLYLGMMWAPECTWIEDFYEEGKGAFVVYWTSRGYADDTWTTKLHQGTSSDRGDSIWWAATTDFTQDTWEFGGEFLSNGVSGCLDTTILRDGETTYHITKNYNEMIVMESTTEERWWEEGTEWTRVQTKVGKNYGSVEGPAVFKDHSNDNVWYLFLDAFKSVGYVPMKTDDPSKGFSTFDTSDYFLTEDTKHGGVISLTKAQYDAIRNADAVGVTSTELGKVKVEKGSTKSQLVKVLPTAEVELAYERGTAELEVNWDLSKADLTKEGTYKISGIVKTIGANKDQWVGDDDSTAYNCDGKELYSSKAIEVTAEVEVTPATVKPTEPATAPTTAPTVAPTQAPAPTTAPTEAPAATEPAPKKGEVCTSGKLTYQVTKAAASGKKGEVMFHSCKAKSQKTVKIPGEVTIDGYKFKVTSIRQNAFKNNKKILNVTIGKNIRTIGKNAFQNCKNLKKITIDTTTLKTVGKNAFKGIHAKATIKVPKKKLKAYKTLLKGKGQKKTVKIK